MKTTKLTVEEAINQGYTHCGWSGRAGKKDQAMT